MTLHPKVAAAGATASIVSAIVAVAALAGVKLDSALVEAVVAIVASVLPVVAGFLKKGPAPAAPEAKP
jgi:hypothetical protein